ncbi:hypothetical protein FQA47_008120 [Oryzias melastigma]|uniref:Uncharacterized protein n=1 Tax=Oryzias melastigma TaxID=30732 RepID=A0A834CJR7_ORYME|nr:hypothetical protein FQA47_008120 [Oryzias melastigma]
MKLSYPDSNSAKSQTVQRRAPLSCSLIGDNEKTPRWFESSDCVEAVLSVPSCSSWFPSFQSCPILSPPPSSSLPPLSVASSWLCISSPLLSLSALLIYHFSAAD